MEAKYIILTKENIGKEHTCCTFSNGEYKGSYELKKIWLENRFENDYVFRQLDERAEVLIEYGPAEKAWAPANASSYLMINCFQVSGKYKGYGRGKALLQPAVEDTRAQGKGDLVTAVDTSEFHFMDDTKWSLRQGFKMIEKLLYGFGLLASKINPAAPDPSFNETVSSEECEGKEGVVVYYTYRCPFAEFCARNSLVSVTENKGIPLKVVRLKTMAQTQDAPTPVTIFSLFYKKKLAATDLSIYIGQRFSKALGL